MYVFNVWATWCVPCREEHEALLAISHKQHVVPIIGLNWKDKRDRAKLWLEQLGNPYQAVAFDPDGRAAIDWGVYGAPETYLVDRQGQVVFKFISPMTQEVWDQRIRAAHRGARRGGAERTGTIASLSPLLAVVLAASPRRSPLAARALDANGQLEDPALQARFETIAKELRCLVCQNESIADSNAELAVDLRRQVRDMLVAGKSDAAIFDFMTDRYGEFVRFSPAGGRKTVFIWGAPFIMLLLGGASSFESCGIGRACRWMMGPPSDPS